MKKIFLIACLFISIQSYSQVFLNAAGFGDNKLSGGYELGVGYRFGGEERKHGVMVGYHCSIKTDDIFTHVSYLYHLNSVVFRGGVAMANFSIDTKSRTYYTYMAGVSYNFCYLEDKLLDGNFYIGVDAMGSYVMGKVGLRATILAKKDRRTNLVSTPNR